MVQEIANKVVGKVRLRSWHLSKDLNNVTK